MPALTAIRRCCSSKIRMYITGSLDTRVDSRSSNRRTHGSWLVTRSRPSDTLADLAQHGNEWEELHYITRDSTMLGFKNEANFASAEARIRWVLAQVAAKGEGVNLVSATLNLTSQYPISILVSPGFVPFNSKMVITPPPALTPELPGIHDLPLCDFIFDERYGRHPIAESRDPYICGLPGKLYSVTEQRDCM
jgi:hypothetical protein